MPCSKSMYGKEEAMAGDGTCHRDAISVPNEIEMMAPANVG
jgi:hypothetical protein